jgi:L-lysine exporter family protein LysE/ArgO
MPSDFIRAILYGLSSGFLLSLTFGTVFFALVQNSIDNGWRAGVKMALGVVASDTILIGLALFGTAFLPQIDHFDKYMQYGGETILIVLGMYYFFRKGKTIHFPQTKFGSLLVFFTSGFLLNIVNPINFFSWVTVSTYIRTVMKLTDYPLVVFFICSQLGIFGAETAIAVSAHKLKVLLSEKNLQLVSRITGLVFVGVGIRVMLM